MCIGGGQTIVVAAPFVDAERIRGAKRFGSQLGGLGRDRLRWTCRDCRSPRILFLQLSPDSPSRPIAARPIPAQLRTQTAALSAYSLCIDLMGPRTTNRRPLTLSVRWSHHTNDASYQACRQQDPFGGNNQTEDIMDRQYGASASTLGTAPQSDTYESLEKHRIAIYN